MKVKSISDVIMNSSTEVWAIRSEIFEKAKSLFRDESWREKAFESDKQENLMTFPALILTLIFSMIILLGTL